MIRLITLLSAFLFLMPELSFAAEQELKLVTMEPGADGSATYSTSLQILLVMTIPISRTTTHRWGLPGPSSKTLSFNNHLETRPASSPSASLRPGRR